MQSFIPAKGTRRKRLTIAVSAFALASTALVVPAYAATAGASPVLIGMGDSYTSGLGAPPYTDNSTCYRSTKAYPLLAAESLGYTGKNIACAGTDTEDVQTTYNNEPAQTGSLGDADWVVMTIGGNNANILGGVLQDETPIDTVISNLASVSSAVQGVLTNVKAKAPDADIILVGYPDVLPANATSLNSCLGDQAGNVDLAKEHEAFKKLNDAEKTAAQKAGVIFVDTTQAFVGHDACATDAWITGVDDPDAPFHANAKGQTQIADMVATAIEKVDGNNASTSSTTSSSTVPSTTTPSTTAKPATSTSTTTSTSEPAIETTTTVEEDQSARTTTTAASRRNSEQPTSDSENDRHRMHKHHHRKHHCLGHRSHRPSFVQNGWSAN